MSAEQLHVRLRRLRLARGLGLREAARAMHMSASFLCRIEDGSSLLPVKRFVRVAHVLGLPVVTMIGDATCQHCHQRLDGRVPR